MWRRNASTAQHEYFTLEHGSKRIQQLTSARRRIVQHLFGHTKRGPVRRKRQELAV